MYNFLNWVSWIWKKYGWNLVLFHLKIMDSITITITISNLRSIDWDIFLDWNMDLKKKKTCKCYVKATHIIRYTFAIAVKVNYFIILIETFRNACVIQSVQTHLLQSLCNFYNFSLHKSEFSENFAEITKCTENLTVFRETFLTFFSTGYGAGTPTFTGTWI